MRHRYDGPPASVIFGRVLPTNLRRGRLGRRLTFCVVPNGGHRSTPRVIAALAGLVHDRQSAADYEHDHNKDNQ
jgi:hypothetical protein